MAAVLASPVGVAWTLASVITLGLVVLIWPSDSSPAGTSPSRDRRANGSDSPREAADRAADGGSGLAPAGAADVHHPIGERLTRLGLRLERYRQEHGHFPAGTVAEPHLAPADRFSWLATLTVEEDPDRPRPLWDQHWHNPLNDPFSRRAAPELLNPRVGEQVGRNRFPATHFVGMGGVGPDAPELPVAHPRAGVFGYERQTRLEDIRDGAANTILVAGVQERLGGWAGGGPGTVRPLTREPYVNGPDGFGTGQADGMLVLMADGSVRMVSRDAAPVVVRRMAAMADGLPLDEDAPGEPGEAPAGDPASPEPAEPPQVAAREADAPRADAPPDPPDRGHADRAPLDEPQDEAPVAAPPPPEPAVDFTAVLAQTIDLYEVPTAVAVRRLLREVEEMIGAPLEAVGGDTLEVESRLDQPVSLRLEQTTVGEILDEVTRRAGLSYSIGRTSIRLHTAGADPDTTGPASDDAAAGP